MDNGINYKFTPEEIEAVAILIKWAQEYIGNEASNDVVRMVATAFNRPFMNEASEINNNSNFYG